MGRVSFLKLASTVENTEKVSKLYNYKSLLEIDGRLDLKVILIILN